MGKWDDFERHLQALDTKAFCQYCYTDGEAFCAIGAFIKEYASEIEATCRVINLRVVDADPIIEGENLRVGYDENVRRNEAIDAIYALLEKRTGLDRFALNLVQKWNDEFDGAPRERYAHVLQQVRNYKE